jgi:hypothetical protein
MQVNEIISCSWGFEQTNVDFYKVISVKGSFVTVIKLMSETIETKADYTGLVMPLVNCEIGSKIRRKIDSLGNIRMTDYSWASKWNGNPQHISTYA